MLDFYYFQYSLDFKDDSDIIFILREREFQMESYQQNPQSYQQQTYPQVYNNGEYPITTRDWMMTLFLLQIPVINIIMLLVWAFGGTGINSKSNFAKAYLLWTLVFIIIGTIAGIIFTILGISLADTINTTTY